MSYRVIITPAADRQLDVNTDWWAEHRSPDEARRWFVGIRAKVAGLEHNPRLRGLAAEDEDLPCELRELLFGLGSRPTHRALFTNDKGQRIVTVLAIRHVAQDRVSPDDISDLT